MLLPLCGLGDKTIFLAARVEHHFAMIVCFLLRGKLDRRLQVGAARDLVLGRRVEADGRVRLRRADHDGEQPAAEERRRFRQRLFVSYPDDLRPSPLAKAMAHAGTFLEFATPLTLLVRHRARLAPLLGLALALLMLHGFILSNMPIAAVFEWNVLSLYAAFFLFVGHPDVSLFAVGSGPLALYLLVALLVLPLIGNLLPSKVSFLVAMRYYAGNWAWNAWLFRDGSQRKLDKLKRAAPLLREQQERFLRPSRRCRPTRGSSRSARCTCRAGSSACCCRKATDGNPFQEYTLRRRRDGRRRRSSAGTSARDTSPTSG